MSFRLRLTVLDCAGGRRRHRGASVVVYYTDRHELIGQVDSDLALSRRLPRVVGVAGPATALLKTGVGLRTRQVIEGHPKILPNRLAGSFGVVLPGSSTAVQVTVFLRKPGALPAKAPPRYTTTTGEGRADACAHARRTRRSRHDLALAARGRSQPLSSAVAARPHLSRRDRRGRDPRRARLRPGGRAAAAADGDDGANRRDGRPERAHRPPRPGRDQPALDPARRAAREPRAVAPHPAAAGGRRIA